MAYVIQVLSGSESLTEKSKALWASLSARYATYRKYRTTLNELRSLSTRELNDLGLNQSTIKSVAMEAAYDA